jgi:hypothetical protein
MRGEMMSAHIGLICSSRKNRFVRLLGRGRATCRKRFLTVKKDAT